jgi:hypothetical protein
VFQISKVFQDHLRHFPVRRSSSSGYVRVRFHGVYAKFTIWIQCLPILRIRQRPKWIIGIEGIFILLTSRTIRQLRRLVGISEQEKPIKMDLCLSAIALWFKSHFLSLRGDEYKFTTKWGDNSATCGRNSHCGHSFYPPTKEEQAPYFPAGYFDTNSLCVKRGGGSEGIGSTNADIPWSIKMARTPCSFIAREGITGHPGPFFGRTIGAINIWYSGEGRGATVRGKWRG